MIADPLAVSATETPMGTTVAVAGEVDLGNHLPLRDALLLACARCPAGGRVVVDLTGVTFLGATGLQLLIQAYEACVHHEVALRLVATPGPIPRTLRLTGLLDGAVSLVVAVHE
ncbi:STAS domain-containing protein [Actinokineospora globicatena]|uniref:Anti-sigma factor antagonist n=1 Tax=Actinokineospora globicatena TaxID=103729 RepID=A0A9W6QLK6_9PSEU|nr:STAS domain-containing protein [Actinokineospora globicatena]GLW90508.1 hypothetical protein Aglo03_13240 [Actinokineospora globicatena]